ncbi:MAG: protein kinase [Pseudomonadota bacterium]
MFVSERANHLFAEALALDPNVRMAFLTTQCGEDRALFDEVSSLLEAASQSEMYFDAMVESVSLSALADVDDSVHEGKVFGRWRLLECVGRGGMGSVYLAERADDAFEKKAAVKMLPFGMDSDAARQRFLQERQILADLSHENIAGLLDGGVTDDGVPYFVMDFVDGQAIDVYCNEHQLDTRARLRLVLEVADALQYAHRNLVIHRDLKPNNILIDTVGRARLLDFGIAKFMETGDHDSGMTRYAQRPVTPAFASPEMLSGETVDVTTDVYSLGVLMYVLLTSHLPISFDGLSLAATIERAKTAVPPPPSMLVPWIHSDLDAVLGKALARAPHDRYSSIDNFANDVRAYLEGRPVAAREPTVWYRFSRFVRRNVLVVSASIASAAALAGTAGIAVFQAAEADRQRDAVVLEQQRTRASNEFFGGLIDELNNEPMTSLQLLDRGTALLQQQYGNEQPFMAYSLYDLARRYARLRETDKQVALLEQTVAAAQAQEDNALQAAALCRLSGAVSARDSALAQQYAAQGKSLYLSLSAPSLEASVDCLRMFAREAGQSGDIEQALAYMNEARDIARQADASVDVRGPVLGYIAHLYFGAERMAESLDALDETLAMLANNGRANSLGYLRVSANKAVTLHSVGRLPEALVTWDDIVQRLRASDYEQRGSAGFLNQYAHTLARAGRMSESLDLYREAMGVAQAAGDLSNVARADLGFARGALASRQYEVALRHLDQLRAYAAQNRNADLGVIRGGEVLRIKVHRNSGALDQALEALTQLLQEIDYPAAQRGSHLMSTIIEAAELHRVRGDYDIAERYADDVIVRMSARAVGDPFESVDVGRAYIHRAEIRELRGNVTGAREDVDAGLPSVESNLGVDHREVVVAREMRDRLLGAD